MKIAQEFRVTFHTQPPVTWRIRSRPVLQALSAVLGSLFVLFLGTLLFFRELEINRKLMEQLLAVETENILRKFPTPAAIPAPAPPARGATVATAPAASIAPRASEPVLASVSNIAAPLVRPVKPRLSEILLECDAGQCEAKLSVIPSGTGAVEGSLLAVLEMEIPRIGTASPDVPLRKKYLVYPGMKAVDELSSEEIAQMESKPFRVTHALNAQVTFDVGQLLRPVALNIYLFDKDHALLSHERKLVEAP